MNKAIMFQLSVVHFIKSEDKRKMKARGGQEGKRRAGDIAGQKIEEDKR